MMEKSSYHSYDFNDVTLGNSVIL